MNRVCVDLFESKLKPIVKKLPKTHILLLWEILDSREVKLSETQLLDLFNRRAKREMIDKITSGDLSDIVYTLSHFDILVVDCGKN